jgi:lysyl-tRNA synthetase class 2
MKPEKPGLILTDSEKTILNIVKDKSKIDLAELKKSAGLSGKQWDKGMKGLNKAGVIRVEVEGDQKFCVYQA